MTVGCVFCGSGNVVKNGLRRRKVRVKQSYLCQACKRQFVEPDGFERMRFSAEVITRAVHQHEDGFSLSKVQNHLWQHDNTKVTRWTIAMWVHRYGIFLKSGERDCPTPDSGSDSSR